MATTKKFREKTLENPVYWVEGINGMLYDAMVTYMENHQMKQKDLAKHLSISPGRLSQIINDGQINFSLEKIIEIALKLDKIPNFILEDKAKFKSKEERLMAVSKPLRNYQRNKITTSAHSLISDHSIVDVER